MGRRASSAAHGRNHTQPSPEDALPVWTGGPPASLWGWTHTRACGIRNAMLTSSKALSRGRSVSKLKRRWAARRGGRLRRAVSSGSSRLEGRSASSQPSRRSWTSGHRARPGEKTRETTCPVGLSPSPWRTERDREGRITRLRETGAGLAGRAEQAQGARVLMGKAPRHQGEPEGSGGRRAHRSREARGGNRWARAAARWQEGMSSGGSGGLSASGAGSRAPVSPLLPTPLPSPGSTLPSQPGHLPTVGQCWGKPEMQRPQ